MSGGPLKVALVALNSPGYRSLAMGYLRAYAQADRRLSGKAAFQTVDLDVGTDAWWVAYRVAGRAPDVAAFSVTCWNASTVYEACRLIGLARPETSIVLGGPEVGPIAEDVLRANPSVDVVVRGEGEVTFAELLGVMASGGKTWRVEGVTTRREGSVASADDRQLVPDLDELPSPYLAGLMEPVEGATYLETYRGCPHRCGYCFEGKGYGRVRHFSQERVAAEVEWLADRAGLRLFSFIDPVFNLTEDRLGRMAALLEPHASNGVRLHTVEVDIERIGPEEARMLRRAGVRSVETGPQSVGAEALGICGRPFDRDRFRAGVAACKAEGISVECDLILGLPGDGPAEFAQGMRFVTALDPGRVQMSTLHVLPGTPLWERASELGLVFDPSAPHEVVATREASFAELRRAEVMGLALQREYGAGA
ncbi:MAG: B12-binding domain-containing radical SAM protein [Coriobacteriia bacterium]|nr:B12-binding domain-containing radical SAM protein [Coriobacteriia bacterium]